MQWRRRKKSFIAWRMTPEILALGKLRLENHEFKARLGLSKKRKILSFFLKCVQGWRDC